MFRKILKIGFGVLFVPFCLGFTWQFGASVFTIPYKPDVPYYFIAGGLTYLTVHFLFKKPILTYVFGHELTHALFAVLFGGSVKAFHATQRGGQVTVTKSNFLITLAPYFFPLYTFLAVMLYFLMTAWRVRGADSMIFFAGAAFCFHLVLTIIFLGSDQKDISEEGAIFSYPLIYLFNLLFAGLLVHLLLAKKNGFLEFLEHGIIRTVKTVVLLFARLYELV